MVYSDMSQTVSAQLRLRDLILSGDLAPGERLSELALVDRMGVSRTPVRAALARLEHEGLVDALPGGGYAVRSFSLCDVNDAIEIRGALEGLAARLAAERGAAPEILGELRHIVGRIDQIAARPRLAQADFERHVELNEAFHAAIVRAADSPALAGQLARSYALPFASPNGFVMAQASRPEARAILTFGQEHHRAVVEAIEPREGARAEALMREHARLARRNLHLALQDASGLEQVPGGALIALARSV
jgi:GntR family transcriptional regulator of vanillate catabolism